MSAADIPSFDELVDELRVRLDRADGLNRSEAHSFKTLMADYAEANVLAERFYHDAYDELDALGQLDRAASGKTFGSDAHARLSAEGRFYLRTQRES